MRVKVESIIHETAINKVGVDLKKVESIASRLSSCVSEANDMGITLFGGSNTLSLIFFDDHETYPELVLAEIGGKVSGGFRDTVIDEDGLTRGEVLRYA